MSSQEQDDRVIEAELALLQTTVRGDRARLEALFAEEFREIGASGRLFDRPTIIQELVNERAEVLESSITEVVTERVADDVVLLTYLLRTGGHTSRRSSLWRLSAEGPRIVFHQGTVC